MCRLTDHEFFYYQTYSVREFKFRKYTWLNGTCIELTNGEFDFLTFAKVSSPDYIQCSAYEVTI